jgi:adenine deaminase
MGRKELIAAARGDTPGDLLFRNGRVVNTFTGEVEETDVLVYDGRVAGLGPGYQARQTIDLRGAYLLPGLINGHTHIESSMLWVGEYARAVVPHGTSVAVSDLHEIANVAGLAGMRQAVEAAAGLPLDLRLMVASCVPATDLETSGATLGPQDIAQALTLPGAIGLGEMMNFPGVIAGHGACLDKIDAVGARPVDGHAPGLGGKALNAYLAAGPRSDHETTRLEEGREKLRRGMYLMIREGTTEKNLEELLPLVTDRTASRCLLVVDDRSCRDLQQDGDVDAVVRKAIALGLDPLRAIQLATINPATYFGLRDLGAIGVGYRAHLLVCDNLERLRIRQVYHSGQLVAEDGRPLFDAPETPMLALSHTFHVRGLSPRSFALPAAGLPAGAQAVRPDGRPSGRYPVIEVVPGQIVTRHSVEEVHVEDGHVAADPERDILKLAVVERHRGTGNVGVGLVRGFGLRRGALASSYAHDSHNIVVVGTNEEDMFRAAAQVASLQGGLVVATDGRVVASLPLPVAGLMSPRPIDEVVRDFDAVEEAARSLGATVPAPFAVLSFLALPVIPTLKLTDRGLVDAEKGQFVDLARVAADPPG